MIIFPTCVVVLLDRLRKGARPKSAPELVRALERVEEIRRLGTNVSMAHRIPRGRLHALFDALLQPVESLIPVLCELAA